MCEGILYTTQREMGPVEESSSRTNDAVPGGGDDQRSSGVELSASNEYLVSMFP